MTKKQILLLVLVLAVAAFFRFYQIHSMPGGLFPDEAAEGLDAQNITHGFIQPFYARGNGREGLFYYWLVPFIKIFGGSSWPLHAAAATIGLLSVFTTYLMAKKLFDYNTGLLAAFLMAVGTWDTVLSRTAFRANLIPLFLTTTVYFIVCALQAKTARSRNWYALLAGAFFAGGFYTYIAYRILVGILGFIAILLLISDAQHNFKWFKEYKRAIGIGLIAFLVVFAPLGYYFVTHPGSFVGRSSQVSIFNPDLNHGDLKGTLVSVTEKSVMAFFTHGDTNWRHNISGQPFLSPLVSIFFGVTLLVFSLWTVRWIWQALNGEAKPTQLNIVVMAGLFWGMLMPVITTAEGIPHGLRSIGMVPAAYVLSAVGLIYFVRKLVLRVWHLPWMENLYWFVAVLFFATLVFTSYEQYFVYAKNSNENYEAFRSDLSVVSNYINANPDKEHTYLVLDGFSVQTVEYLTAGQNHPYIVVDPASAYKLHLTGGDKVIFTNSTLADYFKFRDFHKFDVLEYKQNGLGDVDMIVIKIKQGNQFPSAAFSADKTFWALNLGDRVDWYWQNQSFRDWDIKISQCAEISCKNPTLIKDNQQNDYFANTDHIEINGTKNDLYYTAQAFQNGKLIKDFGVLKLNKYK